LLVRQPEQLCHILRASQMEEAMAELFWLSDEQWQAIAPFMPTNQ
jgi:hypothetical protein